MVLFMVVPQVIKHCLVTQMHIKRFVDVCSVSPLSAYLPPRHCPEAGAISTWLNVSLGRGYHHSINDTGRYVI